MGPLLLVVLVVATDIWVYQDAARNYDEGDPVVLRIAQFRIQTPQAWFVFCMVLWVIAFPLYLLGRRQRV